MLDKDTVIRYFCCMQRTVNGTLLNQWIEKREDGMSLLMKATGLSFYTIDRMRRGKYISQAGKVTRNALCSATGLKDSELFPLAVTKGKAS